VFGTSKSKMIALYTTHRQRSLVGKPTSIRQADKHRPWSSVALSVALCHCQYANDNVCCTVSCAMVLVERRNHASSFSLFGAEGTASERAAKERVVRERSFIKVQREINHVNDDEVCWCR
jgi:hypothetical protein